MDDPPVFPETAPARELALTLAAKENGLLGFIQ